MRRTAIAALLIAVLLLRCASSAPPAPRSETREIRHVIIVILENEDVEIASTQPFLASLAERGALLTNFRAVARPSQPNYIALTSGDTHGVASDHEVTLDVTNIADLLEARGLTWKVYAENYPGKCDLRPYIYSRHGDYVRRHVPLLEYKNVQTNPRRCANVVNSKQLDADVAAGALPSFSLYIPNNKNNGHDTDVTTADRWLSHRFGPLLDDPRFTAGTLLIVTFDEGGKRQAIYAAFVGARVQPGARDGTRYTHYDLLRTIENLLGLDTLGRKDAAARMIDGIWAK